MEPVTHFLTGACIGRAGFNRKTAYATLAATLAAEAPDLDVFWGLRGPVAELQHHRGITHTFLAVPVVAAAATGFAWLFDRYAMRAWRAGQARRHRDRALPDRQGLDRHGKAPQPVRWRWVYGTALVATLSHLLLDWTNDYGLRPFFPFNPRWYAGNLVFIAEPVLWALLGLALVVPALLGLADQEIGARRPAFRGRGWAIFALVGMVALWCWRWAEQAQGMAMLQNAQITAEPVTRIALEPYPINPFRWHALLETANAFQTAEIDTRTGQIDSDPRLDRIYKPSVTPAVAVAKQTQLGRVYLDWSQWPVVRDVGPVPAPSPQSEFAPPAVTGPRHWTTVQFGDLRFDYNYLGRAAGGALGRADIPGSEVGNLPGLRSGPLTGWVYVLDGKEDAGEFLNGRQQK